MKVAKTIILILAVFLLQGCSNGSSSSQNTGEIDLTAGKLGYSGGFIDLDGDGLQDLVVGAPDASASPSKGAVLAYYNSPEGYSTSHAWEIMGDEEGENVGFSFANVGDVDGDGYDDFAVGALHAAGEAPLSGVVYVYRGGQDMPVLLARLRGNLPLDKFGYRVAGGDLNNDGKSDIIVSAIYESGDVYQSGTISIFLGGSTLGSTPDIVISGDEINGGMGFGLATGDINGDNITDLFIGHENSVLIFYGRNDIAAHLALDQTADVHIIGKSQGGGSHSGHGFGDALAFMGDVNNDGFGDLAISNWRRSAPDAADYKGAVSIFKGAADLPHEFYESDLSRRLVKIVGGAAADTFGSSLAVTGDINNGGVVDLLVGASWATGGINGDVKVSGKVYLFYTEELLAGPLEELDTTWAARTYTADTASGEFSKALAANTNGYFLAGAPFADRNKGKAFIFETATGDSMQLAAE
jgi:hypothetical protein